MAKRNLRNNGGVGKGAGMGSTLAITAMSAFAMGTGTPNSSAQASISPQERAGWVQTYKIPPGPMATALTTFAYMNGLHIAYDARVTQRLNTSGLSGDFSEKEALDHLLSGTGLSYRFASKGRTVSIILAQNSTGTQTDAVPAGAEPLPTIDVGAARPVAGGPGEGQGTNPGIEAAGSGGYGGAGPAQDPYNTSYVLENASVGTRTDTPVMETPLNVQVVSQQVLQDQQVISIDQAVKNVSGVVIGQQAGFSGNSFGAVTIRGFATGDVYRNGFRVDGGAGPQLQFGNVASVEVLKGDGSILYGFNQPGGIVNYTTKQPLDAPYYAVDQQIGSVGGNYRTSIDATGPLNADKSLLYRMDMSYQNNGAPTGSQVEFSHDANIFLAPVLKWNIDGANWVKLEADYLYDRNSYFYPLDPVFNGAFVPIPRSLNYAESSPALSKNLFTALSWSHQFDNDWAIKQQIAYYRTDTDTVQRSGCCLDFSGPTPTIDRTIEQTTFSQATFSTNVDITGHVDTFGTEHALLLGGDFYKLNNYELSTVQGSYPSLISVLYPIHPGTSFVPGGPLLPNLESFSNQNTAGLYAQDQIKLPYNFFLMAGARYQYIRQNDNLSAFPLYGSASDGHADTETALTPRFGLLWRPEEWVSFYAHYAEGFSANSGTIYPATIVPPTSSSDTEAGVKFELFDKKLRAGVTYYDLTKTNYAVPDPNPAHQCNGGGPLSCSLVDGAIRSKGVEVDVQGTLLPGWNVTLAYTNMDARITKTNPGPDQTGTLGQRLQSVPRNVGSFTTSYEFQDGSPLKGLKIGGGVDYHGSQPYGENPQPVGSPQFPLLSAWATVNLFTAYSFNVAGTKMTAQVNVTNLLDHTYYTDAYPFSPPYAPGLSLGQRTYGAPFTVLGSLKAEWPGVPSSTSSASSIFSPSPSPATAYTWTGLYVGAQIGYGFGDNTGNVAFTTPGGLFGAPPLVGDASGVIGGAHVGYNFQFDPWVIGVEGTVDGANLSKQPLINFALVNPATGEIPGGTLGGSVASDIQGAIRARAGYAWDRLLIYGAAGAAFGHFSTTSFIGGIDFPSGASYFASGMGSTTRVGWTLGGGVEYAVNDHWSARAEYRYSDFGHLTDVVPASFFPGLAFSTSRQLAQNQVQVGFSYKFGEDSSEPAGFKALASETSLQPTPAPQPVGTLALPGSALARSTAAAAQPIASPAKPAVPAINWAGFSWTGFYVGGQIGYGYGDNHGGYSYSTPGGVNGGQALTSDAKGGIVGGHVGYNQQFNNWVIGLEGAVDATNLVRNSTVGVNDPTGATSGGTLTTYVKSDVQGAVRARAGYAFGRLLTFAAGGVAFGDFSVRSDFIGQDALGGFLTGNLGQSAMRVGWTVGGGVEWAVNNNWSVRGEYRYTDFGNFIDAPNQPSTPGAIYSGTRHLDQNQVQVGFNYKFGDAAPAPASAPLIVKGPAVTADLRSPPPAFQPVSAQALPPKALVKPVVPSAIDWTRYNWTGAYLGFQAGYAWANNNLNVAGFDSSTGSPFNTNVKDTQAGWIGGAHVGYNHQINQWVVGLEGTIDTTSFSRTATIPVAFGGSFETAQTKSDYQASIRGRIGVAWDRALIYGAGGVVFGDFVTSYGLYGNNSGNGGINGGNFFLGSNMLSNTLVGWTAGGGVEYALNDNWSVRGEYRFTSFGSLSNPGIDGGALASTPGLTGSFLNANRQLNQNQAQVGFSYNFGDAAPAPVIAKY